MDDEALEDIRGRSSFEAPFGPREDPASRAIRVDALSHLAHELRAPLDNALARAELLLCAPLADEARREALRLCEELRAAAELADRLLDLSALRSGRVELVHVPFSLGALVEEVARSFRPRAEQKGLRILIEIGNEDADRTSRVCGDRLRLRQLLANLVANAVKYTRHGEVRVSLEVLAESEDSSERAFELRVADTGPGLGPEEIATIFAPFQRSPARAGQRGEGVGLGLAIAGEIAALFGGSIRVESEPGCGSVFGATVWLAVEPDSSEERVASESRLSSRGNAPVSPAGRPRALAPRVLVVEDSEPARRLLLAQLRELGCQVAACSGLEGARREIEARRFDVVIADLHLDGASGLELLEPLRAQEREGRAQVRERRAQERGGRARVILVSAAEIPQSVCARVDRVARKPLDRELLRRLIFDEETPLPISPASAVRFASVDLERALFQLGGRREILREVAALFLQEGPLLIAETRAALGSGDPSRTRRAAHRLRSSLGLFGVSSLLDAAEELEAAALRGDLERAGPAARSLEVGVEALRDELAGFLQQAN